MKTLLLRAFHTGLFLAYSIFSPSTNAIYASPRTSEEPRSHLHEPSVTEAVTTPSCEDDLTFTPMIESLCFSSDGQHLSASMALVGEKREVGYQARLWGLEGNKALYTFQRDSDSYSTVALSTQGCIYAVGNKEKLNLWKVADGSLLSSPQCEHGEFVMHLAFSPDETLLAGATYCYIGEMSGGRINVWNTTNGRLLESLGGLPEAPAVLSFSPDGKILAAAVNKMEARGNKPPFYKCSVTVWNMYYHQPQVKIDLGNVCASTLKVLPDNRRLIVFTNDLQDDRFFGPQKAQCWDIESKSLKYILEQGPEEEISSIDFPSVGDVVVGSSLKFGAEPGLSIKTWNAASGKLVHSLRINEVDLENRGLYARKEMYVIDVSPDDKTVAIGLESGVIQLRNLVDGQVTKVLPKIDFPTPCTVHH